MANCLMLKSLVAQTKKKSMFIIVVKRHNTGKSNIHRKYPLFIADEGSRIIQNVIGNILESNKEKNYQLAVSHLERLKPYVNRNWALTNDDNGISSRNSGMNSSLKQQLFSPEGTLIEIEKHIKLPGESDKKIDIHNQDDLMVHQNKWLVASVKAANTCNQYHRVQGNFKMDWWDVVIKLEHHAETIIDSLEALANRHSELEFKDFKIVILALGCWWPIHTQSTNVKNRVQTKIDNLLNSLETGSFERIFHLKLPLGSPLYLKDASDRLDLAQIWIYALSGSAGEDPTYVKKIRRNSFPATYIGRATNSKMGKYNDTAIFVSIDI